MSRISRVFPKGRHGVLRITSGVVDTYYKFIDGTDQDGERRQLVTRGPGKEKAATVIPLRLPKDIVLQVVRDAHVRGIDFKKYAWQSFTEWWRSPRIPWHEKNEILKRITVLLLKMPRGGNLVTGWEWNAPGGTGTVGESFTAIAEREFNEEANVAMVGFESPFPPAMFASGIYDEVQAISFAIIVGNPTKLVEGAREWCEVPLFSFRRWVRDHNQMHSPQCSRAKEYVPVDGKVVLALWWLTETVELTDY